MCDTGHDAKILLPATHGQKYLRSNGTRESRPSTATGPATLQVHTSMSLPLGPHPPGFGLCLHFCPHTSVHTRPKLKKHCVVSGCTALSPVLRKRSRCGNAHVLSSLSAWGHAPPDGHVSPQQILGKLFVKSQLAACLEVPGCKGLGLIKQPVMKHSRKLRRGRYSCAFLKCVCVLLIAHPGYQRRESGRGYWNQKNKSSKGIYSRFPKGKGV